MLREISLFIIVSLACAISILPLLSMISTPIRHYGMTGPYLLRKDVSIFRGVVISKGSQVSISIKIEMEGYFHLRKSLQLTRAYLFVIPEEDYYKKMHTLETLFMNLSKEEILDFIKKISVHQTKVVKKGARAIEASTSAINLQTPLVLVLYLEGDLLPLVTSPYGFHCRYTIKPRLNTDWNQVLRALDVGIIGLVLFVIGDLRREDSWLRRLKRYTRGKKSHSP